MVIQSHLIGATITLCLDSLHREEGDVEFGEHRKLIDRAVNLLGAYGDGGLTSRGLQLISSLSRKAEKSRADDAHTRATQPQESEPLAWPLEQRLDIEAMTISEALQDNDGNSLTASEALHSRNQSASSNTWCDQRNGNAPYQQNNGHSTDRDVASIPGGDIDFMAELSCPDLFLDSLPASNGLEDTSWMDDLFR